MDKEIVNLTQPILDYGLMFSKGDFPPDGRAGAIDELIGLGYYRFVRASSIESLVERTIQTGNVESDLLNHEIGRESSIDCENLYEQGIAAFIEDTKDMLAEFAFKIELSEEEWGSAPLFGYPATINEVTFIFWNEPSLSEGSSIRYFVANRAARALNYLLSQTQIEERMYTMGQSDYALGLMVTRPMIDVMFRYRALVPILAGS